MTRHIRSVVRTDREGQTLAIVAVSMVALLALLSLGIDLGMAYTARAEAQRVADSAALAGASAFLDFIDHLDPEARDTAYARAFDYAGRNVVRNRPVDTQLVTAADATPRESEDVTVEVIPAEQKVRVWIRRAGLPAWFSRFLGRTELNVMAYAAAQARNAGSSKCVKPFAIPDRWEELSGDDFIDPGENVMDFDNDMDCNGAQCKDVNEVWTFDPTVDDYRPLRQIGSTPAYHDPSQATSWGSTWLNGDRLDAGERILITPQSAQGTGTPGWYQYWKMPGSSGASDLTKAIQACIDLDGLGIGDQVDADPQTGNIGNPVFKAFENLWDPAKGGDADIEWDPEHNRPHYPGAPNRSIWDSPRVFTVLLVHPADVRQGASHSMRIVDFATVFLEVPEYGDPPSTDFKYPIWGRLFHFGPGTEGPTGGTLQKFLRLVE